MIDRRRFLGQGAGLIAGGPIMAAGNIPIGFGVGKPAMNRPPEHREKFPRLRSEVFLNAAGGTPQGDFAAEALSRYQEFWQLGPGQGRGEWFGETMTRVRSKFAGLIGAAPEEIALVHCTKAGEQVVIDGLPRLRRGGNLVTNDLHFSGSLHNFEGLRRGGVDVRVVRAADWRVDPEEMIAAMDANTALVAVSLVSNINGHLEDVRRLADAVHRRGGYLYADIIQAAGVVPFSVTDLGIDAAACSGYKWLYGPHGSGFLYVRRDLQGEAIEDRLFPGHARFNYRPWVDLPDERQGPWGYQPPADAGRYQPGHVSYLGYAALEAGLSFIEETGVDQTRQHAVQLNMRLLDSVNLNRFEPISPHAQEVPILTFRVADPDSLRSRLMAAQVVVSLAGDRLRISPAVYNNEDDIDALVEVMNGA